MGILSKRSTVYFDPSIHQALKIKAASSHVSISEIIDEAVRLLMSEDQEDLAALAERKNEQELSYEDLINDLKVHGKI
ncbi:MULTISPECIES: CopG family transcriptional regulator [unclassified Synechocystis]|uniref:ribbon-helix-helix domain-containing protein n=1 Tax=unclassified Synechocystis TaxID=2640012 RepID=UPI0003F7857D|nr:MULTISPECIES: CopG family transcriptional regulator [unclassified Synechocystis]AIE75163.1 RelB/StbD replicon stabilization protein (antitoxin to RelE/StbE) [Synechocystis sp. PCC 6714]MCT0252926.1 ribbon-helix-helix domain-containing protein [Synechocystis sp. CS-94]